MLLRRYALLSLFSQERNTTHESLIYTLRMAQHDMGYDISNYEDIHPQYGTLADMDDLTREIHARGMKLLLDLVINHTSDQHAWFQESRTSKTNRKADWYMWRPPKYSPLGERLPPNNWAATFGGSAWEYVPERDEYYLHSFLTSMPDLNWESATTREAIYESAIRFWLRRGVDGFRVDVADYYSKDVSFADAAVTQPGAPYQSAHAHFADGPRMHEFLRELRREACGGDGDVMLVGECSTRDPARVLEYVAESRGELSMIFDFDVVALGGNVVRPRHEVCRHALPELKRALAKVQRLCADAGAWATVFAENHDNGRSIPRLASADPRHREASAKLLALMLATLTGTLFLYQGQEIGMANVPLDWVPAELKDAWSIQYWDEMTSRHPHDAELHRRARAGLQLCARDNARTPMQWDASEHAGFTTGAPWMRVNDNYREINVASELERESGVLAFWRRMLALRKRHRALFARGDFEMVDVDDEHLFTYIKHAEDGAAALVILNFSSERRRYEIPEKLRQRPTCEFVATDDGAQDGSLKPWSGVAVVSSIHDLQPKWPT